jgi:hypothetical protein
MLSLIAAAMPRPAGGRIGATSRRAVTLAMAALFVSTTAAFAAVSTDKYLYAYGETVQINGDEMDAGETVTVEVFFPDGSLAQSHDVIAADDGTYADSFYLADGMPPGDYRVVATGLTSGRVFETVFDPPSYTATVDTPTTAKSVDYSDVVTYTGTLKCVDQSGPDSNKCTTENFLFRLLLNSGQFKDYTEVASSAQSVTFAATAGSCPGAAGCTENWSFNWQAGKYGSVSVDPGTFKRRVRVERVASPSNALISGNFDLDNGLTINKEDTVTVNGGPFTGQTGTSVSLSATVDDEDASQFLNDANFGGTVLFELQDGSSTTVASVSDTSATWNSGTEKWDFSASLDLTGVAAGSYTLKATFTPSASSPAAATYYNGSSDSDSFEVTSAQNNNINGFYQPIQNHVRNGAKAGSTIPLKFNVCEGEYVSGICDGTNVTDTSVVTALVQKYTCSSGTEVDMLTTDELSSGNTSLRYDSTSQQFVFNWKTPKSPGCYRVTLTIEGGEYVSADFELK